MSNISIDINIVEEPDSFQASAYVTDVIAKVAITENRDSLFASAESNIVESKFSNYLTRALGELICYDNDLYIFKEIVSRLQTVLYNKIKVFPRLRDIDTVFLDRNNEVDDQFLNYIKYEVGVKIPETSRVPLKELLRDSKVFYSGKTTKGLYYYLGQLHNVVINIDEPARLIFRLSDNRTVISGAYNEDNSSYSKLGRIRDGIVWSYFTYFIDIYGLQDIDDEYLFEQNVKLVHPAGTQYFYRGHYNFYNDNDIVLRLTEYKEHEFHWLESQVSLDNNFMLDGIGILSSRRAYTTSSILSITGQELLIQLYSYRRFRYSVISKVRNIEFDITKLEVSIDNGLILSEQGLLSRRYSKPSDRTTTANYTLESALNTPSYLAIWNEQQGRFELFSSENPIVYEFKTQDANLSNDPYSVLADIEYIELKDYAYNQLDMESPTFNPHLYPITIELVGNLDYTASLNMSHNSGYIPILF